MLGTDQTISHPFSGVLKGQLLSVFGLAICLLLLVSCASKDPKVISVARNRNFGLLFSNLKVQAPKELIDDYNHRLAEQLSKIYGTTVFPLNFSRNDKIDFKAIYLTGVKDIDTLLMLDGEAKAPIGKPYLTFQGFLRILNPSTFKEILSYPLLVTPRDYKGMPPMRSSGEREQEQFNRLAFLLEKKIVSALRTLLPDPHNYPRQELAKVADLLFEHGKYAYALDLYLRLQREHLEYQNDLLLKQRVDRNIDAARKELEEQKKRQQGFALQTDLTNVKEKYRSLLQGIIQESYLEDELKAATLSPAQIAVDFDDVFNKCQVSLSMEYDRVFYQQNLAKFRIPPSYQNRKVISFAPYKAILKEFLSLKQNISKKLMILSPNKSLDFSFDFTLVNINRRLTIPLSMELGGDFIYPTKAKILANERRPITVETLFPTVTRDQGLFVLGDEKDASEVLTPYGLVYLFFSE